MAANSFGRVFTVTTFGESHGKAIGVVIDGVPSRLSLDESEIQLELNRRRPAQSRITTQREERDRVEILSGIFEGKTTGAPLALLIRNEDQRPSDYEPFRQLYRPGHADFGYQAKYGFRDWRGGGRASGRETAARVAAGAVAKRLLGQHSIRIIGYALEIAGIRAQRIDYSAIEENIVRSPDPDRAPLMIEKIEEAKKAGDSVGGIVEVVAKGVLPGLGDPVFDKLEALLAHAVMSIGAVKGFEVGEGFGASRMRGSEYNDPFYSEHGSIRTRTNSSGGILGGISTGEDILLRAAVRSPASIGMKQETVDMHGKKQVIEIEGRHDPCIVPRVVPVVEAMVAITLADSLLMRLRYQNHGSRKE